MESKISSMLSRTGSTKHALSMPISRPAFISVGLLGMNRPAAINSKKRSSHSLRLSGSGLWSNSASAIVRATRRKRSSGASVHAPDSSLMRYRALSTLSAFSLSAMLLLGVR